MPVKKAAKKSSPKSVASGSILINFVLDKSGSMATCLNDTIGGFNTYIDELKRDTKSKYSFSLTLFDTNFENRHVAVDLSTVPSLTKSTYVPNGGTALFDAIGRTVSAVEAKGTKHDKVLTVILTDGEENSSKEYSLKKVKELIERKESEGNWTFVFLGADLSAFKAGDSMGIRMSNSIAYNQQNVGQTFSTMAAATMSYSAATNMSSTDDLMKCLTPRQMRVSAAAGMSRRTGPSTPGRGRR